VVSRGRPSTVDDAAATVRSIPSKDWLGAVCDGERRVRRRRREAGCGVGGKAKDEEDGTGSAGLGAGMAKPIPAVAKAFCTAGLVRLGSIFGYATLHGLITRRRMRLRRRELCQRARRRRRWAR
jgi:hypothetical protein